MSGVAFDFSSGSLVPFLRIGALVIACWAGCYLLFHCCCIKKTNKRKYSKLLDDGSEDEVETFSLKDKKSDLGKKTALFKCTSIFFVIVNAMYQSYPYKNKMYLQTKS